MTRTKVVIDSIWASAKLQLTQRGEVPGGKQAFLINRSSEEIFFAPPEVSHFPSDIYAGILEILVSRTKVDMVVIIMETWMTEYTPGVDVFQSPSLSANRVEGLVLVYKTADGESGALLSQMHRDSARNPYLKDNSTTYVETDGMESFNILLDGIFVKSVVVH